MAVARSAHHVVGQALAYSRDGATWVVDLDREPVCDRVNHDG
jgi:hypothetical protein